MTTDTPALPADAGLPQFIVWLAQQALGMGWISAHTLAGVASVITSAVALASFIAPHLPPPAAAAPSGGWFPRLLYRAHRLLYRLILLFAQARGNVAPAPPRDRADG